MTNENERIEEVKHECLCQNKGFRNFLVIATGTFVGVFCALSLFAALHKPPMMMPCPCHRMMGHHMPPIEMQNFRGRHHGEFRKHEFKKFHKEMRENRNFDRTENIEK